MLFIIGFIIKFKAKKSPVLLTGLFYWLFVYGTNQPRLLKRDDGGWLLHLKCSCLHSKQKITGCQIKV